MTAGFTVSFSGNPELGLKPDTECRECFRRGFNEYVNRAGLSKDEHEKYMRLIEDNLSRGLPPPLAGADSWALLRKASLYGEDIFREEKLDFTEKMLAVYGKLRSLFMLTDEPAAEALAAATWCNLLDVGQGKPLPEVPGLLRLFKKPLAWDERAEFMGKLKEAEVLLILGDNAGETVMDRLFLELSGFPGKRYYMTREKPVMNDALTVDARRAGLHLESELISSGIDVPAVIPELLSGSALRVFESADLILAKGQGNLEGLFGLCDRRIYHSFVVKCPVVSRATETEMGLGVFRRFMERGI